MALIPDNVETRESSSEVQRRFRIAQDTPATDAQLAYQQSLREKVSALAVDLNADVADSREKSLALTSLEEFLMWAGKAIFR